MLVVNRIDAELERRLDLSLLAGGKHLDMEDDIPKAPNCSPGGEFGIDVSDNRVLQGVKMVAAKGGETPSVSTLEEAISYVAKQIPHLPLDSPEVPSMKELNGFLDKVSGVNNIEALNELSRDYSRREELLVQLVNAMSFVVVNGGARPMRLTVRPL